MTSVASFPGDVAGQTRAQRMRQPLTTEVITATAEKHGVCARPFTMEVGDPDTGELRYVAVPCGSTVESVCGPCARKAKALRQTQCREGWHLDTEPDFTPEPPSAEQTQLLEYRADLVAAYRQALAEGAECDAEEVREEIRGVDEELRTSGMRGAVARGGPSGGAVEEAIHQTQAGRAQPPATPSREPHDRPRVCGAVSALDVRHPHPRHLRAGARRRHSGRSR